MNLAFVKYVQSNSLCSQLLLPCSVQSPLAYGWVKGGHWCSSFQWRDTYSLFGLEKSLSLPRGARSPEVSRGRKLDALAWAQRGPGPPGLLVMILPERRAVLGKSGHCSFGSWPYWAVHRPSGHLPLGLGTWFKGRLPKGRKPKWKHLPAGQQALDSRAQRCGGAPGLTFPEPPGTGGSLQDSSDLRRLGAIIQGCVCF